MENERTYLYSAQPKPKINEGRLETGSSFRALDARTLWLKIAGLPGLKFEE
jgi:hypothetical protein